MLEIVAVVMLTRKLAEIAAAKGQAKGWAALGPVLWIIFEIGGVIIGTLMGMELGVYLIGLGGAAVGAAIAWQVVANLPNVLDDEGEGDFDHNHGSSELDADNVWAS